MKKILFFTIIFIFINELINAQSLYFNKRIDITGGNDEVCRGILPFNNGYLVAGGHGPGNKIYMSFLDSLGNLVWTQHYTQTGYNYFFGLSGSLFQTMDKYFAICGGRAQYYGYGILIKVDSLGNKKWEKEFHFYDNTVINSGNTTKDNGCIFTGNTDTISPRLKYLLLKTDSLGNMQWYKTYTDNHPDRNYAGKSVIQTPDNGYCIGGGGGYWSSPGTNYQDIVEIIKTDSLGNQQWKKSYGNPLNCNSTTMMLCLSNDSCIIGSYSLAYSSDLYSNRQLYITKIGLNGIEKWNKKIGNVAPNKWPSWIQKLDDGSVVFCGNNAVEDTLSKIIGWLFKLNNNGDSLWYKEYSIIQGETDVNELWHFSPTPDKGFAAAGSLFPNSTGGTQDIWVF